MFDLSDSRAGQHRSPPTNQKPVLLKRRHTVQGAKQGTRVSCVVRGSTSRPHETLAVEGKQGQATPLGLEPSTRPGRLRHRRRGTLHHHHHCVPADHMGAFGWQHVVPPASQSPIERRDAPTDDPPRGTFGRRGAVVTSINPSTRAHGVGALA